MQKNKICQADNCNNKLKISDLYCRCNKKFCIQHRLAEYHNCSYNYKYTKEEENKIINQMKLGSEKVIKL
jgi:hypothetical protein